MPLATGDREARPAGQVHYLAHLRFFRIAMNGNDSCTEVADRRSIPVAT